MKIAIIEGPLLDKLGSREPEIYGGGYTRGDLEKKLREKAAQLNISLEFLSSYVEGELAGIIADSDADGIIINPGAYTHTSVLLRDALLYKKTPFVEAHFSNIFNRESFRKTSYLSDVANGFVCGFGPDTYLLALEALSGLLSEV